MRAFTSAGSLAGPVITPYFFWYLVLHLARSVMIRRPSSGIVSNCSSQTGNTSSACSR